MLLSKPKLTNLKIKSVNKKMNFIKINRLKRCINFMYQTNVRFLETDNVQAKLFVNMLGMKEVDAQEYIKNNKIAHVEPNRLSDTLKFFSNSKFKKTEILQNPKLFQMCSKKTWEQYYLFLEECGCQKISILNLIDFRKLRYLSVKDLKDNNILPKRHNLAEHLLSHLNPRPENLKIDDLMDDELTLTYIHTSIVNRYIIQRLDATVKDIEKLSRIHHQIYNKSLKYLCENIDIALDLGYTKQKLLRNGYILHAHPKNTKEVLSLIPDLAGTDMRVQMRLFPKLIGLSIQNYLRIYEILKKESISDDIIKKSMNIFTLSPKTVEARLQDIKSIPETRVLMNNPKMLNLILHYYRARNRLTFLEQMKLKCASLRIIGAEGVGFENHVKEGKDVNKTKELDTFIRTLVKEYDSEMELKLKKHPYHLNVPLINIEETYFYLRSKAFLNNHIINAVQILLYPKEKIRDVLDKIKSDADISNHKPRLNKTQVLNVALYFLEKDHHFTGNGIWPQTDDDEKL